MIVGMGTSTKTNEDIEENVGAGESTEVRVRDSAGLNVGMRV